MGGLTMKLSAVWMVALMALLIVPMKGTVAQIPECAMKLVSCVEFLNTTTKPPSSCCTPLKEALTKEFPCLCKAFTTPGLLASFGINVSDLLTLPPRCKLHADINSCSKVVAPSSAPVPSPSTLPSSTPEAHKSEGNSLIAISWTATCSMLLLLISVMFTQN